ncbi:uromodulin-like [Alosa alosa]|uniref:uromodulin-like n=1 Tax=Alosa alosa TaxID=278164 RepID=UPI0020153FEC|nr:uromodulin-like [Alosa alosa]
MTGTRYLCVFLLLLIPAISTESTGTEVTSCEACHEHAGCSTDQTSRVTCACGNGFIGNGLGCYNSTLCGAANSPCCSEGYHWSSELGCVDVDECAADVQPCLAPLVCKNTAGSFNCLLPPVNYNPLSSLRTVQFSCGSMVCNVGQDCVVVDGTARCLDPCQHYTVLDDAWRSSNHHTSTDAKCDMRVNWQGWYRMFLGGESVQMAERCLEPWTCGTQAPLWLKSPHPVVSDGVVQGDVCGSWTQGCCNFEFPIHVKACPGNYYVYKFVKPPLCFLAYGADVNTKVCGTCKEGENCVSEDKTHWKCEAKTIVRLINGENQCQGRVELFHSGTWGTVCDDDWSLRNAEVICRQLGCGTALEAPHNGHFGSGSGPIWLDNVVCQGDEYSIAHCSHQGFEVHNCGHNEDAGVVCEEAPTPLPNPEIVCSSNSMQVGLPKTLHSATVLDTLSGHMADPQCNMHLERNGTIWYQVQRRDGICGNVMRTNSTHVVFSNTLFVYPAMENVTFTLPVGFPFSCVYPLDMQADMHVVVKPYLSMQEMGLVGFGPGARAIMSLYHNVTFTEPYPEGAVTLPVGSALNVGINTEGVEKGTFVVILEDCYTTNTSTPDDPIRHYFIKNRCISDPLHVTVLESGSSLQAHFSAMLFLYQNNYRDMFVHCSLSLCDKTASSCSTECLTRKSRSIAYRRALTVGPITWAKQ